MNLDTIMQEIQQLKLAASFTKDVLTVEEAAAYMGMRKSYAEKVISRCIGWSKPNGDLKSSGKRYVSKEDVNKYLLSNPIPPQEQRA